MFAEATLIFFLIFFCPFERRLSADDRVMLLGDWFY